MPEDKAPATAIASYALWWGTITALGKSGVLTQQEILDGLDQSLLWLEQNQQLFSDQASLEIARQFVEARMKAFRGGS
jgi:hypothetical protein